MTTNLATNNATQNSGNITLLLDFDKKKLTDRALRCETTHQRLQTWLNDSIIEAHFQEGWKNQGAQAIYDLTWGEGSNKDKRLRTIQEALNNPGHFREMTLMQTLLKGLRKNNAPARPLMLAGLPPSLRESLDKTLDSFMSWRQTLSSQRLSPLYQTLITVYYLTLIQPMGAIQTAFNFVFLHQELQKLGFGAVADYILDFYAQQEPIFADALSSCYHARDKKYHQQPWFQLFFEAWEWALERIEHDIQVFCLKSCFNAHANILMQNKTLNERQFQLVMMLKEERDSHDRKSLQLCLWYRTLYKDLTKRTQERDFALISEHGFI